MKQLGVAPEKEDPIVCSICGYPTEPSDIEYGGLLTFVKFSNKQVGRWALHICKNCAMNMEEIEKNPEMIGRMRKGFEGEHR